MKRITALFATDFSSSAENALNYFINFARPFEVKLLVLHVVEVPLIPTEVPYDRLFEKQVSDKKELGAKLMKTTTRILEVCNNFEVDQIIAEGDPQEEINKISDKYGVDLIVMGNKKGGIFTRIFNGDTVAGMIEKGSRKILAISEDIHFSPVKTIVYACAISVRDHENINVLSEYAKVFDAEIIILNVIDKLEQEYPEIAAVMLEEIMDHVHYKNIKLITKMGTNVSAIIKKFTDEIDTDLLVMATHHRSFFEAILAGSTTEKVLNISNHPMLIFHLTGNTKGW
ncbi:universal stress protein [Sporocytophaga myxococcoides]|uniref:universal stress protein n=1 Tax=Sporocytophaga myxococcoides TaxID=153721 RepID=UPI00040456D7|nr:universal stress protein [Sporocytophaga myxococcoides]